MNVIVISDLRAAPIAAVISLTRRLRNQHVELWLSEQAIMYGDYSDNCPRNLRRLKVMLLKFLLRARVIRSAKTDSEYNYGPMGIESSLKSITQDSLADSAKYPELWKQLHSLHLGAIGIAEKIVEKGATKVYLFNGRLASMYAISRMCFARGISSFFYEYSRYRTLSYKLLPFPVHNMKFYSAYALQYYLCNAYTLPFGYKQGFQYIGRKLTNKWVESYKDCPEKAYDVVIFLSSPHEYMVLDEELCGIIYRSELSFVSEVVEAHGVDKRIAVRCHPNQAHDPSWETYLSALIDYCHTAGVDFYPPESSVSSYDLIRGSGEVAVDISSIGLDAIFLGAKVTVYGDPFYKGLHEFVTKNDKLPPEDKALELASMLAMYEIATGVRMSSGGIAIYLLFWIADRLSELWAGKM